MLNSFSKISSKLIGTIALLLLTILVFLYFQPYYLPRNFALFLGLIFAPFIIRPVDKQTTDRFLLPTLLLGSSLFFIKTNSLYYGFGVFLGIYIWESRHGRLNNLPLFLFAVSSFLAQQVLNNWSFPIRLQLSALAGKAIGLLGYPITVSGNMIYMDGQPFSVDPACMGLKMMVTAQLLALVIFAYFERKDKIVFSFTKITFGLFTVISLTIFANFIRLLALIIFKIMPDNPLHDIIGLVSLVVYVLLPFYIGIRFLAEKSRASKTPSSGSSFSRSYRIFSKYLMPKNALKSTRHFENIRYLLILLLSGLFLYQGIQSKQPIPIFALPYPTEKFANFEQSKTKNGILKLENNHTLVYIKPPVSFFQGSHDPRICWRGSGYTFQNIQVKQVGSQQIYTAILKQENEQFYTAWWYDNLENTTIEEWQWRLEGLKGLNGYFLVNISSLDKMQLLEQVAILLK